MSDIDIESSWKELLQEEFHKDYIKNLKNFLVDEKSKYIIYPKNKNIFNAFWLTPFDKTKVVILGQDPYHGDNQAQGLSFSVPENIAPPPSLVNIFKELRDDLSAPIPKSGDLSKWAMSGVLLLNSVLTVRQAQANSHQGKGWEIFTDKIIELISSKKENIVFILWGRYAQDKSRLIDTSKHYIIKSPHPSPLSSYRGFFGSKPFSKTNDYLISKGIEPVGWTNRLLAKPIKLDI